MIEYKVKVDDNGTIFWFINDKLHREDGPAVEHADGSKSWYLSGECHREDGPAIERANGDKYWYLNGEYHREDGPAVDHADGTKHWYLNDVRCTEEEYYSKLNPAKELTMEELVKELGYNVKIIKAE